MIAFVFAVAIAASPAVGQGPPTIDPGMTQAQVVAKLGEPLSTRTYDGHTYLLTRTVATLVRHERPRRPR
jgi:hypothetical protein